jgi:phosphoglycerate dehydrogenase-like enzyme
VATLARVVITLDLTEQHLHHLHTEFPAIDFVVCPDQEQLPEQLRAAQALIGGPLTPAVLAACPELRWLQSNSAGMDRLLTPELVEHDIIVTNYSGAQASNMAEHLLAMMFAFARGLPLLMRRQAAGEWTTQPPDERPRLPPTRYFSRFTMELSQQTLAIAGLGEVGRELAKRAKGIGMRVIGSRRQPGDLPPGVDRIFGPAGWHEMLSEADHVAICLPLTPRTQHLFGEAEFKAMKSGAYIYNTSRGAIIDQDALIQALTSGEIAGAGLDVTTPEPLPPESPLWSMPNVLITCHTSGASPYIEERGFDIIVENIHRYLQDRPLLNLVDKREGY